MARYLAVTAVLELHIGCCLNYWQPDNRHRSHWHLDDHRAPGWSPEWRPSVRFLQALLTHVWGLPLKVDGDYGPRTQAAAREAMRSILAGELTAETWPALLEATARRGFAG
jgi:peptidoglycan hydrolase-like protein with peptidoglycan-binding domain